MTGREAIALATRRLSGAGIEAPRHEARLLLAQALGVGQESLLEMLDREVPCDPFLALLDRRCRREPLAFITGKREFWSLAFEVSPATLIPRPESETLIEAAVKLFRNRPPPRRVLDLGTGTGCLLLAALSEFPAAFGIGIDRIQAAAALARRNAIRLGMGDRAAFVRADWAAPLAPGAFDLVLSNPPYIPGPEIAGLMPEISGYEPRSALDGGKDGLMCYRALLSQIPLLLTESGTAIIEIGKGQEAAVSALARRAGLTISVTADLSGTPRAVVLSKGRGRKTVGSPGQAV